MEWARGPLGFLPTVDRGPGAGRRRTDQGPSLGPFKFIRTSIQQRKTCRRRRRSRSSIAAQTTTMPPRIPARLTAQCCRATLESSNVSALTSVFGALSIQSRSASILSDLRDNRGAYQKRIRVGRGPSSGKGKTSGRGHKGQKQHGKVNAWFQGGQTPLLFQRGRMGFDNMYVPGFWICPSKERPTNVSAAGPPFCQRSTSTSCRTG